jgi:hypothetical protein
MRVSVKASLLYLVSALLFWTAWEHADMTGFMGLLRMFLAIGAAMPAAAVLVTFGSLDSDASLLIGYAVNAAALAAWVELRSRRMSPAETLP